MSGNRTARAVSSLLLFAAVPAAAQQEPMVRP